MKVGEYKSLEKALDYNLKRFKGNLKFVHQAEMEIIEAWLASFGQKSIIFDLGAGTGRAIKSLLKAKPKIIYAFDESPAMLKLLKENYPNEIKKGLVKIMVGSSDKISLPGSSVDIVISLHVFKHIKDINQTLKETHRILKTGGVIIFDVLNINSIVRFNLGTCYALDKSSVIKSLEKNGFNIVKIVPLHAFGETVYNFPGSSIINLMDKFLTGTGLPIGTKFFILTKKHA